jgi:hypothetical protein
LGLVFGIDGNSAIVNFLIGLLFGLIVLVYNDYRVRKLTGQKDNEEAYQVRPKKKIVLFTNIEKAYEICRESVRTLHQGRIADEDQINGVIKVHSGISLNAWGNRITYKLTELTDVSTEIELSSAPILRTALVDYGEGYRILEVISEFLDEKNSEMNQKYIVGNQSIPTEVYTNMKKEEVVE